MAKAGRNEPCPCGSGRKYKRCCGRAPELPTDRRLMERELRAARKIVEGREFQSMDELNVFLQEASLRQEFQWTPETSLERAQELVYQALEASSQGERFRLVMQALETSQDCADAYVLLAEDLAEDPEQAKNWYQKGVEAGERALRPEAFSEDVGHFWGLTETRPYMRARDGLADCLWLLGQRQAALGHYREMLRLNPNDNQGIRYKLLNCLLEMDDVEEAETLLSEYEDEGTACWLFTRAFVHFLRQGDTKESRTALKEAMEENPYVLSYLLGRRRLPRKLPDYVGLGDRDEAVVYAGEFGELWAKAPGALAWLASQLT